MWDYVHDVDAARTYDAQLVDCGLLEIDQAFFREYCHQKGRTIDLGCGTGRLAVGLAREGHRVLAVDLSAEMLRIVGEKAGDARVSVDRLQANLVELDGLADESFDNAACLFSTLGLIAGQEQRQRFLANVHRLLVPGGRFILHVHNRWFHFWTSHGRKLLLGDLLWSCLGRKAPGDFEMPGHQGIPGMPMHLFTRREIVQALNGAGFRLVEVRPVSLRPDGKVPFPLWFGWLRSYGYLIAATK